MKQWVVTVPYRTTRTIKITAETESCALDIAMDIVEERFYDEPSHRPVEEWSISEITPWE